MLKSRAGLFFLFSSRQVAQLKTAERNTQSSALTMVGCEDSSLLFKMPTEKMQWIQLSVTASTDNWQMPSYPQFIASLYENYLFFSLNQTILQLDHFFQHFPLHICQSMCQHSWSVISAACIKIQPCQSPVLEVRSPTAASSQLHSTSKRKTKNFKEPYKWCLWQTSMKMPKQRHLWDPDLYIFF